MENEGWSVSGDGYLEKKFEFKGMVRAMAFANAVAWIAERLGHHPELRVSYGACMVRTITHDLGNRLGPKDYVLASEVDALLKRRPEEGA